MRAHPVTIVLATLAAMPGRGAAVEPAPPATTVAPSSAEQATELLADATLCAIKQDWAGAEASARAAIAADPTLPDAWHELAHALAHQDQDAEAVRSWEQALQLDPGHAAALEGLGRLQAARGALDVAEALLERLRPIDDRRAATLHHAIELAREGAKATGQPGDAPRSTAPSRPPLP